MHEPRLTRDQPLLNRRDHVRDVSSAILDISAMTSLGIRILRSLKAPTARLDTTNQRSSLKYRKIQ